MAEKGKGEGNADLSGKVALVTGAGSGIGRATALRLAAAGAKVALLDRDKDELEETTRSMSDPEQSLIVPADVTDEVAMQDAVERILSRWGRLDIVIGLLI